MLYVLEMERNIVRTIKLMKTKWIGYVWRNNCILKRIIEGKMKEDGKRRVEEEEDVSNYRMTFRKRGDLGFEIGRTRSQCMENWLWKGLRN
jgi:hypothetical protein